MSEAPEIRRKRVRMRAEHRGMREMDLILGAWAAARLDGADPATLDAFEALLEEPDQDIYAWVTGREAAPVSHAALVSDLARVMDDRA
ncbi:succinate dehydrogenase assembly factor 2 [Rhodobacterales bacterium HKCCE3408]|nr:succinate dehydrogenase assembly factor 2 [Rhodobacterales bacterium HKCCE3408]